MSGTESEPVEETEEKPMLTSEDLNHFLVRRHVVEQAQVNASMVKDGFRVWAQGLREKYGIVGAFDVNVASGEIVMKEEPDV